MEARRNEELVSLASSQTLRWIDELRGIIDVDAKVLEIRNEIRNVRKEPFSLQNRRRIRKLYEELDRLQFKSDYVCIIFERKSDYHRACKGFSINGVKYRRLLGTNGGIKNKTIVFVSEELYCELHKRIENGRDEAKEIVPAKLEAYKSLTCSASVPVSMPKGILVVPDCETEFISDVIFINDEECGEPTITEQAEAVVQLNDSDGYGLMLPSLAQRWAEEMGLKYIPSGVNTRFAFNKGMAFCFDFLEFAEIVAGNYVVNDIWGDKRDIRDIELILTASMLKLWDSYNNLEHYLECCDANKYQFGITKVSPETLESERNLNYQFIQSYDLSDEDIDELIEPTMSEVNDILDSDYRKTILFLKGAWLNEDNLAHVENDFIKSLMIEPDMVNDPFIRGKIHRLISNRIDEAKVGVIKVHGNYSLVSGDPYSLCQSIFGLDVTGLLKAGEVYNAYWSEQSADKLVCFRAPMTCHNNIRSVMVNRSDVTKHWYRNMSTVTVLNSWDTICHALNGMDKDGDIIMLTDNRVLVDNHRNLPALICTQRVAEKKVVDEEDFIKSNIDGFGDDIGKITNRITSMFDVRSRFSVDSKEYRELDYRIMCGQLFQQDAIDAIKGVVAKPMPTEWYDRYAASRIANGETRDFYMSISADKKPYFMRYIYPDLMKRYNKYIKNVDKNYKRKTGVSFGEIISKPYNNLSAHEQETLWFYQLLIPVSIGDCVVNKICKKFEQAFSGYVAKKSLEKDFDYTIMKSGASYTRTQYNSIIRLLDDYNRELSNYKIFINRERINKDDSLEQFRLMNEWFIRECDIICPNSDALCNIMLDACYNKSGTKQFVWSMCRENIIKNLIMNGDGMIKAPVLDSDGDIKFGGKRFSLIAKQIGGENERDTK